MADTSQFLNAGGAGFKLAPDSRELGSNANQSLVVTPSASLQTVLSLSGKWAITGLYFTNVSETDTTRIKLTIDGVVINDYSFIAPLSNRVDVLGGTIADDIDIICSSSLVLEVIVQNESAADLIFNYVARPIL